ncbi:hypothetical protein SLA2020_529020 [Shorea laevis]
MRVGGEMFIRSSHLNRDGFSTLSHPFNLADHVELARLHLDSAEKVGHQLYDRASILLNQCDKMSSKTGNSAQRVVYYFSEFLSEKIDRERGRTTSKSLVKERVFDGDEALMCPNVSLVALHKKAPFSQVMQFSGIQALVENVTGAKKVHIIDLNIISGVKWTAFMEALASEDEWPLEHLKITALRTTSKQSTGMWLMCFAKSMGLPFSFKIVYGLRHARSQRRSL